MGVGEVKNHAHSPTPEVPMCLPHLDNKSPVLLLLTNTPNHRKWQGSRHSVTGLTVLVPSQTLAKEQRYFLYVTAFGMEALLLIPNHELLGTGLSPVHIVT